MRRSITFSLNDIVRTFTHGGDYFVARRITTPNKYELVEYLPVTERKYAEIEERRRKRDFSPEETITIHPTTVTPAFSA